MRTSAPATGSSAGVPLCVGAPKGAGGRVPDDTEGTAGVPGSVVGGTGVDTWLGGVDDGVTGASVGVRVGTVCPTRDAITGAQLNEPSKDRPR